MTVPFLDLAAINAAHRDELIEAFARVLDSGWYVLGQEVTAFESEFAEKCGTEGCVGVGSGLDALTLVLRAWREQGRLSAGDEVIVPANTYIASVLAITEADLIPVLAEPTVETFNISADTVAPLINERTKVLLPVHLYGRVAEMPGLMDLAQQHDLLVLEDAAQAHGAELAGRRAGAWGDAAAFSFYPAKNLGALGDGGAIVSSDGELLSLVRSLRNYGSTEKYRNDHRGTNSRLDELQAALLRVKLARLDEATAHRRAIARHYLAEIDNPAITLPDPGVDGQHVWHLFVVRCERRAVLQRHLRAAGVGTLIHYPIPPHHQHAYADAFSGVELPLAEQLHREVLSLPIGPTIPWEQVSVVVDAVNAFDAAD